MEPETVRIACPHPCLSFVFGERDLGDVGHVNRKCATDDGAGSVRVSPSSYRDGYTWIHQYNHLQQLFFHFVLAVNVLMRYPPLFFGLSQQQIVPPHTHLLQLHI